MAEGAYESVYSWAVQKGYTDDAAHQLAGFFQAIDHREGKLYLHNIRKWALEYTGSAHFAEGAVEFMRDLLRACGFPEDDPYHGPIQL